MRLVFLVLLFAAANLPGLRAADWPCYRGANGDGVVTEPGLAIDWPADGPRVLWAVALADEQRETHAGPAVAGDKVIVPTRSKARDSVCCFDAATGKELWRYQCQYDVPEQSGPYGTGIRATPTIWKDRVFILGCFGQLLCLETNKGELIWTKDLLEEFKAQAPPFGMSSAPTIIDDLLICQPGGPGAALVALEPATGKVVWQSGNDQASYAAPQLVTLCGVRQILAFTGQGLLAVHPATGKELWHFAYPEQREKNVSAPIALGDTVYFSNNTLGFCAVRLSRVSGRWLVSRIWDARKEKTHYSSPLLGPGCLYFHNSKREIKCLSLSDGGIQWTASRMGTEYGALLQIAAGRLLAMLDDGQAVWVEVSPRQFTERARFQALGKCFPQPAVAGGKLYVRDHERLVCFDLKNPASAPDRAGVQTAAQDAKALGKHAALAKGSRPSGTGLLASWKVMRNTYFAGWLAAVALALLGVLVVKRKQVLAGAAVTQSATLALAIAMWLDGVLPTSSKLVFSSKVALFLAAGFAVAAAFLAGLGRERGTRRGLSGMPWGLLVAASVGVGFISQVQLATIDLHHVLASTIIEDTRSEVARLGGVALFTIVFLALLYSLVLRPGAPAQGACQWISSLVTTLLAGLAIGLSVRATGTLFTFAFLVFPALAAERTGGGWLRAFAVASGLALAVVTCGFAAALSWHVLPAQLAAALICLALPLSAAINTRLRENRGGLAAKIYNP